MAVPGAGLGAGREEREITIPVPWGHIAGKAWNKTTGIPALFVHGHQDNAGSFDTLIPLLPDSYYCVAIDLPGHGKSSHFPKGLPLKLLDYTTAIERAVDFLGWDKFVYIGHSLGGLLGFFFAALFQRVTQLVFLDAFIIGFSPDSCVEILVRAYSGLKDVERGKPRTYSHDEAVKRIKEGRPDLISQKAAEILAKRSLVECEGGVRFSWDQRLKVFPRFVLSTETVVKLLDTVRCPILQILMTETLRLNPEVEDFWPFKAMLEKNLGDVYRYHVVEGYHGAHLDHPERVRGLIVNFLANTKSQL